MSRYVPFLFPTCQDECQNCSCYCSCMPSNLYSYQSIQWLTVAHSKQFHYKLLLQSLSTHSLLLEVTRFSLNTYLK